jgi:N-acetylmuramoyl-L-alanine amidase
MKYLSLLACALFLLSGCVSAPKFNPMKIDERISAKSQDSRVRFLILHYTALNQEKSLEVLTQQSVSSHYLVGDDPKVTVYRLVDENRAAFHAGVSSWKVYTQLNANSIGIEIVNLGYQETPNGRVGIPFPQAQIDVLIGLIKDIVGRHNIKPENILGHGEIAPQRKPDPGPLFPWKQLADAGLITWPNQEQVEAKKPLYQQSLPEITWFQTKLALIGYSTPQTGILDKETLNVLKVFQSRYRQSVVDGTPDAETAALLDVITQIQKK